MSLQAPTPYITTDLPDERATLCLTIAPPWHKNLAQWHELPVASRDVGDKIKTCVE